jgi:protein-tyrosine phosphatase
VTNSPFTILTVCTGNICRSPFAEAALRDRLDDLECTVVHSAGTRARDEESSTAETIAIGRLASLDLDDHRARTLVVSDLRADLILALGRQHRREIVSLLPLVSRRTFTLREFAGLTSAVTEEDLADARRAGGEADSDVLRATVRAVAACRGLVPTLPGELDVSDPYHRPRSAYERMSREILPAVDAVASLLRRAVRLR